MSDQLLELFQRCLSQIEALLKKPPVAVEQYEHLVDHAGKIVVRHSPYFSLLLFPYFCLDIV
jgi:hypothetical protein